MSNYYDEQLGERLPATNSGSVVLNSTFAHLEDHIEENIFVRGDENDVNYSTGKDKKLLGLCREHARAHELPRDTKVKVAFTHPLYLSLTHMDQVDKRMEESPYCTIAGEAQAYIDAFFGFLHGNRDNHHVEFVLIDTIHDYAAATSFLLEQGLIDRVVFSQYDRGALLPDEDFQSFADSIMYFAGGYEGRCLSGSISDFQKHVSEENFWGIRDLVIAPPEEGKTSIRVNWMKHVRFNQVLSLEETCEKLGLTMPSH